MDSNDLKEAQEELHLLRKGTEPGGSQTWLNGHCQAKVEGLITELTSHAPTSIEQVLTIIWTLGQANGVKWAGELPYIRADELQSQLDALKEDEDE